MRIIQITKAPKGFTHTVHPAGFAVLGWESGKPVVALAGKRKALDENWQWIEAGHEL